MSSSDPMIVSLDYEVKMRYHMRIIRDLKEYEIHKRVIDLAVGLVLLSALWPVILLLMFLVKGTSKGPALYTQVRLGRGGRRFTIYKIRSMGHDCERATGPRWSTQNDPRVTPLGRVLRRTHLDELPQLWNVVRGDMSLVGPRPERPEIASKLELVVPGFTCRTAVRPGMTGLAQIQLPADSDICGVRRKLAYDMYYARQMGPWLDLRVLAGTALKLIGFSFESIRRSLLLPLPSAILKADEVTTADQDSRSLSQLLEAV